MNLFKIFQKKTIHTYYEDLGDGDTDNIQLLKVWQDCWQSKGWKTVVLTREDAKKNPRYQEYYDRFMLYPTTNSRKYEMACFLRWVAMEMIGGYHCDFDVMNYGFKGEHGDMLTFYSKYLVPAMVWGRKEDYSYMLDVMMNYDYEGKEHVSDQNLLVDVVDSLSCWKIYKMPEINQEDDWEKYPLVHFPNERGKGLWKSRSEFIEAYNKKRGGL